MSSFPQQAGYVTASTYKALHLAAEAYVRLREGEQDEADGQGAVYLDVWRCEAYEWAMPGKMMHLQVFVRAPLFHYVQAACAADQSSRKAWVELFPGAIGTLEAVRLRRPVETGSVLEQTFMELAQRWREETAVLSSITRKSMHPAYQRIIGMGPRAVPLIMRELEKKPGHWFWALTAITGEDPVPPENAGDIEKMAEAWLSLGRERGWL